MGTATTITKKGLALGQVETWAGPIRMIASALGVQRVQLPDWHTAIPVP